MNKEKVKLTLERKEYLIDQLLIYMKDDLENLGQSIDKVWFEFIPKNPITLRHLGLEPSDKEPSDLINFRNIIDITNEELEAVIKACVVQEYVEARSYDIDEILLTYKGLARANSAEKENKTLKKEMESTTFNIGTLNATNSNVQVGNNNKLEVGASLEALIDFIEKSNATEKEKNEAKSLLKKFIDHPIISGVVVNFGGELLKKFLGGI